MEQVEGRLHLCVCVCVCVCIFARRHAWYQNCADFPCMSIPVVTGRTRGCAPLRRLAGTEFPAMSSTNLT